MIKILKEIVAITFPLYIFLPLMLFTHHMTGGEFKSHYTQEEIIDACIQYKLEKGEKIITEYEEVKNRLPDPDSDAAISLAVYYNGIASGTRGFNCFKILEIAGEEK